MREYNFVMTTYLSVTLLIQNTLQKCRCLSSVYSQNKKIDKFPHKSGNALSKPWRDVQFQTTLIPSALHIKKKWPS